MKTLMRCLVLVLLEACAATAQVSQQQFGALGDFRLENGEVVRECSIGFRTYGTLNSDKSNVVLVTTWFGGSSGQLAGNFGPRRLVDTSKYYAIAEIECRSHDSPPIEGYSPAPCSRNLGNQAMSVEAAKDPGELKADNTRPPPISNSWLRPWPR